jgi:hypothetical protein
LGVTIALARIKWLPAYRIVPSRFPSINIFDRVASAEDFEALYRLEALTNDRIRDEVGELHLVPPEERLFGPGTGPIMAAFTHPNPLGSRFSDGSYGVFYAGHEQATAVAETRYHQGKFLRATNEGPLQLQMRVYHVDVAGELHDLRPLASARPELYDPESYAASQPFGRELHAAGAAGLVYGSVRNKGGVCVAAFRPRILANCRHAAQMLYSWDGEAFTGVFEQVA